MNFIKNILDNKIDEMIHLQFQKFSKGEFRNRALIYAKHSGKKYTMNTSAEFTNGLVKMAAEKLNENKTMITGAIVSTSDLTGKIEFKEKKQFQGVKRYLIEKEMSGKEILELLKKFPKSFFALSFSVSYGDSEIKLKIKPKAPKSGKPIKKDGKKSKPDFCKIVTTDKELGESFIFENPNFKEARINHTFFINEMIIPENLKNEKDFSKIREIAKRKGKIVRYSEIDGEETTQDIEFEI